MREAARAEPAQEEEQSFLRPVPAAQSPSPRGLKLASCTAGLQRVVALVVDRTEQLVAGQSPPLEAGHIPPRARRILKGQRHPEGRG